MAENRDEIQAELKAEFDAGGDLAEAVNEIQYHPLATGDARTYNNVTGKRNKFGTPVTSRALFLTVSAKEKMEYKLGPRTIKMIIIANEISVEPTYDGLITSAGKPNYRIAEIMTDPLGAVHEVYCSEDNAA